jgi:hypothetical protein
MNSGCECPLPFEGLFQAIGFFLLWLYAMFLSGLILTSTALLKRLRELIRLVMANTGDMREHPGSDSHSE